MTITATLSPSWDPIIWKRGASSPWFGTFLSDKSIRPLGDDPHSSCYHQDLFLSHLCPFLLPHTFSAASWISCLLFFPLGAAWFQLCPPPWLPGACHFFLRPAWYWNPFWSRVPVCNPCFFLSLSFLLELIGTLPGGRVPLFDPFSFPPWTKRLY